MDAVIEVVEVRSGEIISGVVEVAVNGEDVGAGTQDVILVVEGWTRVSWITGRIGL